MSIAKIHGPGELLASVETLLGFTPRESIVVVGLGDRERLGVMMRLDRADCLIDDVARELGRSVGGHLARGGFRAAFVVSYSDEELGTPCEALDALLTHLREWVEIRDAFTVSNGRFRSQWCLDPRCCPRSGNAVPQTPAALGQALRDEGARVSTDPGPAPQARGPVAPPAAQRRRVTRARDRALLRRDLHRDAWCAVRLAEWRAAIDNALDGRMPTDAQCGRIIAGLSDVRVRDGVIVGLDEGFEDAADAVSRGEAHPHIEKALAGLLSTASPRDCAKVEAAVDLGMHLGRMLTGRRPDPSSAAPYCVAAIGLWLLEDSCGSLYCLTAALEADPAYHLAKLISATFAAGLGPQAEDWH